MNIPIIILHDDLKSCVRIAAEHDYSIILKYGSVGTLGFKEKCYQAYKEIRAWADITGSSPYFVFSPYRSATDEGTPFFQYYRMKQINGVSLAMDGATAEYFLNGGLNGNLFAPRESWIINNL